MIPEVLSELTFSPKILQHCRVVSVKTRGHKINFVGNRRIHCISLLSSISFLNLSLDSKLLKNNSLPRNNSILDGQLPILSTLFQKFEDLTTKLNCMEVIFGGLSNRTCNSDIYALLDLHSLILVNNRIAITPIWLTFLHKSLNTPGECFSDARCAF